MSSVPNLRLSVWDSADDPLDFSAVAGDVFYPLRRRATKSKRASSREFVEVRTPADKRAGGAAEGTTRKRAPSPEFVEVRAASGKRTGGAAEGAKRKRAPSPEVVELPAAADKWASGAKRGEDMRAAKKGLFTVSFFLAHYTRLNFFA
jgi:tyrosyl-DNA phosphodiesterase 2